MLAVLFLVASTNAATLAPALKLRGGADLGPVNADLVNGALKVAAAVTASGALAEKYAGMGSVAITKVTKDDYFTTNVIIALVTYATNVVANFGDSGFDAAQVTAGLWAASVLLKFKDADFDVGSLKDNWLEVLTAAVLGYITFA